MVQPCIPAVTGSPSHTHRPPPQDGSQIALVLDLGAHHLDLMFSDPRDPPCAPAARDIEARMIRQWCQEAYAHGAQERMTVPSLVS